MCIYVDACITVYLIPDSEENPRAVSEKVIEAYTAVPSDSL